MCSINEEDLEVMPELLDDNELLSNICKKCSSIGTIVLRKRDVYCVNCFVVAANHKFRASLGKNKIIRANQKVAVAVSGGLASCVLLHFTHNGLSEDAHKKLRVEAICIHVYDDTDDLSNETARQSFELISQQCKQYGLQIHVANLSNSIDENVIVLNEGSIPPENNTHQEKFKSLITNLKSNTSRIDLVTKLKRKLLLRCAEKLECSFILSGEISTTLASSMLSNITLGRGSQVECDVGFCDSRDILKILRPIKELTYEEAKLYAGLKNVSYRPKIMANESIQTTIEKFVNNLQENFSATISTICKTGEKMGSCSLQNSFRADECIVCQSTLDTQDAKSSALQATEFSRLVSATGPNHDPTTATTSTPSCESCHCSKKLITRNDIERCLCYGCRLILRDIDDQKIPEYFESIVKNKLAMNKLRNEINDFLI